MSVDQIGSGVPGLDRVLAGGYVAGTPTLLLGPAGCGKTLFLLQFAAETAARGQRAVFATCTESPERLASYMEALGQPVDRILADGLLVFVDLRPIHDEMVEGQYNLDVVKVRIDAALRVNGRTPEDARLCIDDLNRLAYAFDPEGIARETTLALLRLLRDANVTTLITMGVDDPERVTPVTYAVDTIIELNQTVENRLMTRTLRVPKMRGVGHGTNAYPFLIDESGPRLIPITGMDSVYQSRGDKVSTGHTRLDELLGGGLFRGSAVMITGASGTGKSTVLGQLAVGLCAAGMTGLYLTFEQDKTELCHDLGGVGLDVGTLIETKRLDIQLVRSVDYGLEEHLIRITRVVLEERPGYLIIDAVTALNDLGKTSAVKGMLLRLIDVCKANAITLIFAELLTDTEQTGSILGLSSLLDVWIRVELYRQSGEYVRLIRVLKGRGAATSSQLKEFRISSDGIAIEDAYTGAGSYVFGTEKLMREQVEAFERDEAQQQLGRLKKEMSQLPITFDARVAQTELEREAAMESLRTEIATLERRVAGLANDAEHVRIARGGNG